MTQSEIRLPAGGLSHAGAAAENAARRLRDGMSRGSRADTLLGDAGCLDPAFARDPARLLREVAAVDLSLGRLIEGHVNALSLIEIYADAGLRASAARDAAQGHLFGVWGADAAPAVQAERNLLTGAKRYASGLGAVSRAVVSAATPEGQRLFVIAADDTARQDQSSWDMSGMQQSHSGRFDCDGLTGRPLGPPDIYTREPHFVGGTWRIAAVTLGATIGLIDRASRVLASRDHLDSEAQLLRLGPLAGRVVAAWPAIERAGRIASGPEGAAAPERAAALSVSMRLLTEDLGQDAIAAIERSVGLQMFAATDPVGAAARDLACYMRQAARDAFTLTTGRAFLGGASLGSWLDD